MNNYNTQSSLWLNMASAISNGGLKPTQVVIVEGHVYLDTDAIARFDDNESAIATLEANGWQRGNNPLVNLHGHVIMEPKASTEYRINGTLHGFFNDQSAIEYANNLQPVIQKFIDGAWCTWDHSSYCWVKTNQV